MCCCLVCVSLEETPHYPHTVKRSAAHQEPARRCSTALLTEETMWECVGTLTSCIMYVYSFPACACKCKKHLCAEHRLYQCADTWKPLGIWQPLHEAHQSMCFSCSGLLQLCCSRSWGYIPFNLLAITENVLFLAWNDNRSRVYVTKKCFTSSKSWNMIIILIILVC